MAYDTSALEVTDVELDLEFTYEEQVFLSWKAQEGKIRIIASQLMDHAVSGDNGIVNVTFQVLKGKIDTTLTIRSGAVLASSQAVKDADLIRIHSEVKAQTVIVQEAEDLNRDRRIDVTDMGLVSLKILK